MSDATAGDEISIGDVFPQPGVDDELRADGRFTQGTADEDLTERACQAHNRRAAPEGGAIVYGTTMNGTVVGIETAFQIEESTHAAAQIFGALEAKIADSAVRLTGRRAANVFANIEVDQTVNLN